MKRSYLILSLFLFFLSCKFFETEAPKEESKPVNTKPTLTQPVTVSLKAVVIFSVGNSKVNGKKIQRGDSLDISQKILVEPKSFLDIEVVEGETTSIIRVKGKAIFHMSAEKLGEAIRMKPSISLGTALFNIKKFKKQVSYNVVTPTLMVGVRGTQFQVMVTDDGSSLLKLTEGEVTSSMRLDTIDSLRDKNVIRDSDIINEMTKSVETEIGLKPGEETDVTRKEVDAFLKKSGLDELIKDPNIKKNIEANIYNPQSKEDLRKSLDSFQDKLKEKNLDMAKSFVETDKEVKSILQTQVDKQKKVLETEFKELGGINEEFIQAGNNEAIKKAINDNINENSSKFMKRMEAVVGKKAETIMIKGGKKLKGILRKSGEDYIITTVDGDVLVPASDFEGAIFK